MINRSCGYQTPEPLECKEMKGTNITTCACENDLCNSAPGVYGFKLAPILLSAVFYFNALL